MNGWSIVLGAVIGSLAWLYQKAWERRTQRAAIYEKIVRQLPSVTATFRTSTWFTWHPIV